MGMLQDASETAFRRRDGNTRTDSQAGREDAAEQRAADGERNPDEEVEKRSFAEGERTDASSSAIPKQSSRGSRHDPGGSWLAKCGLHILLMCRPYVLAPKIIGPGHL
ncbi:hypothetical protein NDU88_006549 [Pleurodeles waltl]|uniref:Uncharacterized protein n=1 Tax=Pleurodeles waltl TaxID=8319 RepID=A0AAV7SQ48_PLEWA|nr:hypothetical protein NDU88_006549 [Pleurodeles waltl]